MVADRAYLKGARLGSALSRLEGEVARILGHFGAAGAMRVEPSALQPAELLLDLYGEDIRARAFVTADDGAEMMLRPDFTLPIVRLHTEAGAEPARYAYCGPVWRRQEFGSDQPREYLQAGFEIFEAGDPAGSDAEVLALILAGVGDAPVEVVTGDLGLVFAAIDALETSAARKAALRRHVWRPARFRALLERYGVGHAAATARRAALIAAQAERRVPALIEAAGVAIGLRDADDIAARVEALATEAETPPLDPAAVDRIGALLAVTGDAVDAVGRLRVVAAGAPDLLAAVDRAEARLAAFADRGIDPRRLRFEASFGRTTLEYYDGFVFGVLPKGGAVLPPVASGGRYDALTAVLGRGTGIPAVGGIILPEALLALREGGSWR